MNAQVFGDREEYWFHVSNQNEIPIYGHTEKSIDSDLLYDIAQQTSGNKSKLKKVIYNNVDAIDTLRTIVGISDKRMYLELSFLFNKYRVSDNSDENVLGESIYRLKKHDIKYFKKKIQTGSSKGNIILDEITNYLVNHKVLSVLKVLSKLNRKEVSTLVDYLLLPKEIQQEETKKRGHGAEQKLAQLLHKLNVAFIPDKRHINPMSQDDPNVDKKQFELKERNEATTWSMDLIIKKDNSLKVFVQGLVHSSDPGQYGVNKSGETVTVKKGIELYNDTANEKKELWGLVDGVGFVENPEKTIFKMLKEFDTFIQLKSLYKAGLRLHKLGMIKIKAIRFDMSFYSTFEANQMFELYGSEDIKKITDGSIPKGEEIQAGKAWLYI